MAKNTFNTGVVGGMLGGPFGAAVGATLGSGSGKGSDQKGRDSIRDYFQGLGLVDNNYSVTLADGSTFDVGLDGDSGKRPWKDPSRQVGTNASDLFSYDVDYTSDLDYFSGMGGISLSRLLTGQKAKNVDQLGGQLGNAAISNIGFGADFTQENFNKMTANQRALYAKAGIKSKEEAYALANQGLASGRLKEEDVVSMQQSFNLIFDNDFATAQKLNAGRWNGLQAAGKIPSQGNYVPPGGYGVNGGPWQSMIPQQIKDQYLQPPDLEQESGGGSLGSTAIATAVGGPMAGSIEAVTGVVDDLF